MIKVSFDTKNSELVFVEVVVVDDVKVGTEGVFVLVLLSESGVFGLEKLGTFMLHCQYTQFVLNRTTFFKQ